MRPTRCLYNKKGSSSFFLRFDEGAGENPIHLKKFRLKKNPDYPIPGID